MKWFLLYFIIACIGNGYTYVNVRDAEPDYKWWQVLLTGLVLNLISWFLWPIIRLVQYIGRLAQRVGNRWPSDEDIAEFFYRFNLRDRYHRYMLNRDAKRYLKSVKKEKYV